jgi:hypothetical protein
MTVSVSGGSQESEACGRASIEASGSLPMCTVECHLASVGFKSESSISVIIVTTTWRKSHIIYRPHTTQVHCRPACTCLPRVYRMSGLPILTAYLPSFLLAFLPACLLRCLLACDVCLPAMLAAHACIHACDASCMLAYLRCMSACLSAYLSVGLTYLLLRTPAATVLLLLH